jgi:glycosyltransferase involved in cell wall biosynthesis
LLLSSRLEGLPAVVIEALSVGTPVVATDCPTGPHEILDGGRWGRLVAVGDVSGMARALDETLSGNRRPNVPAGLLEQYSVGAATAHYLELLRSIRALPTMSA